ncbi:XRE family transcriptional regulator [Streptococcus dysgalactiae subsp. dysgalactiae]|nr:helix-turn-helix transcriptional regulator [Streptococcus dysgalactiae]QGG98493.1 XRE family transcriptional regulator [Streptococcus dysgalactiae subsp. dysgalactiae]
MRKLTTNYLIHSMAYRLKELRVSRNFSKTDLSSNREEINIIENAKIPEKGNFISASLLDKYCDYFQKTRKEIIFGNDSDINDCVEHIFIHLVTMMFYLDIDENFNLYADCKIKLDK